MTKREQKTYLDKNLLSSEYEDILNKICPDPKYVNELRAEVYIILYDMIDKDRLEDIIKGKYLKYYYTIILKNQYHSSTSPFYRNIRKNIGISSSDMVINNTIDKDENYTYSIYDYDVLRDLRNILSYVEMEYLSKYIYSDGDVYSLRKLGDYFGVSYGKSKAILDRVVNKINDYYGCDITIRDISAHSKYNKK